MVPDEFASLVSHELRNPLHAMAGWMHLLAADPALRSDGTERALAGLRRALEQQFAQVDTLAGVLRLRGGTAPAAGERIELPGLLEEVAAALRERAREAKREVVVGSVVPACVVGDRAALRSALEVLGAFAMRHGVPGAALELSLEADDPPRLRVSIDEGDDGGLSVWHAFGGSGGRLSLDLLHATLAIEAHGARVAPHRDGRQGDWLEIRFASDETVPPPQVASMLESARVPASPTRSV
jgi:signal transduction histidine kinase